MTRLTPALLLTAFAACAISEARVPDEISVELASVTLADNCATATPPPPPSPAAPPTKFAKPPPTSARASSARVAPGACATPGCGGPRRQACEQTSMQLAFNAQAGVRPTTIKIKRVELLDTKGNVLEVLNPSAPTRWTSQGAYVTWDETIEPNDVIRASYALNAPNWTKLTNGRFNAHGHTFQLRVTVTIGTSSRTVEKQSITPARIAPMVVT